jgi:pSer/pThr/pTyr-binding forkhead associated (FHA) protein
MLFMDLLGKAQKLESRISRSLDLAVEGFVGRSPRQPVEIIQAILDAAEQQVQPAGRGRRVFPYNTLTLHVLAASRSDKAQFEAVAAGPPSLQHRVIERLRSGGCQVTALDVQVRYVSRGKREWTEPEYHIAFDRVETARRTEPVAPPMPARIDLGVAAGSAERRTYTFEGGRIDIGRRADVLDHQQQLIRRNHIAFIEGDDANRSVSRKHAHITWNPAAGEYRVHDDASARGTAVVRTGQTIRVPQGSRGIRLHSGDEIVLGDARLRVKLR